jgi:hypothetical protein
MRRVCAIIVLILFAELSLSVKVTSQTQGNPNRDSQQSANDIAKWPRIVFHVTSSKKGDDPDSCQTGQCEATLFTVEGHADVNHDGRLTQYVLKCMEYIALGPSPHQTIACAHLHAGINYDAWLVDDTISFLNPSEWKPLTSSSPSVANYDIVSEREVTDRGR